MSDAPTVRLDRAREAHLFAHPEEATGEDVRGLMRSLQEMRRAAIESAEAGGGVAVVVRLEDAGGGYLWWIIGGVAAVVLMLWITHRR